MYNLKTKKVALSFLLILGCCFIFSNTASAVDVFLTSDCISGNSTQDVSNLHSVEGYIENGSLKDKVNVTVDPKAPHPGEGERAIYSTKTNGVAVYMAASCPGTMKAVAKLASSSNKGVIFVNTGQLNLKTTSIIRRAWDDNFSNMYFAGIKTPYIFLRHAGVWVIQPNVDCAGKSQAYKNQYIANAISNIIAKYGSTTLTSSSGRYYDTSLIATHKISPATMAKVASGIYNSNKNKQAFKSSYNGYRLASFLLMSTYYMNGPIKKLIYIKGPRTTHVKSTFSGSITRTEYRSIAASLNSYMRKYKRAPSYIRFKGKIIGYRDAILMFAILTKGHTSSSKMTLASSYKFRKVYRY